MAIIYRNSFLFDIRNLYEKKVVLHKDHHTVDLNTNNLAENPQLWAKTIWKRKEVFSAGDTEDSLKVVQRELWGLEAFSLQPSLIIF